MLPLLGIETTGELCSVCLMAATDAIFTAEIKKKHVHSEKLFGLTDYVLSEAGLNVTDLKAIAVSEGPGSFTGLRIGYAAAKGLATGADLPIIPVPGFEAMALQASLYLPAGTEFIICNKVNVSELYFASFKSAENSYEKLQELQLIHQKEFDEKANGTSVVFGDYNKKDKMFNFSSASAEYVNKWAYIFGKDLLTFRIDNLEPKYLKNFVARTN